MTLTKREREVMREWEAHTGWEFMPPHEGESFYDALQRNRRWLEQRLSESLAIGNDIQPAEEAR